MMNLGPYTYGRVAMPTLLGWEPPRSFDEFWRGEILWDRSPVKVQYDEDRVCITADMPGVDPKDLDLTFEAGSLSISGHRGDQSYDYVVALGDDVDPDKIQAELDKGVLTIEAEKKAEAKPRKIALKGGEAKSLESGESH